MIDQLEIWRRRSWMWWVPLLFVALNIASIVFFQLTFAGQLDKLEGNYANQAEQLSKFKDEGESVVNGFLQRVNEQEHLIGTLYRDHFGTESERFTRVSTRDSYPGPARGPGPEVVLLPGELHRGLRAQSARCPLLGRRHV